MIKKMFSAIISIVIALGAGFSAYGENILINPEYNNPNIVNMENVVKNEEVTFIVEVSGDAVLASEEAAMFGARYLNTKEGRTEEELLIMAQEEVISEIEEKNEDAQIGFTYTALFNGFSLKAKRGDLEQIQNIPGVKNVYISEELTYKPHLSTSVGVTGSLPAQTSGYTGSGQAVAIIDNEFDVDHKFFSSAIENEKFSQDNISELLTNGGLIAKGAVDEIYKNEKIPFAYDYYEKDTIVYSKDYVHGTHVAGIVGGKNGEKTDGTLFSGVAPEAQLILMKVGNEKGAMNADAIIAALEDAAKIGVCAINCSYGIEYASPQMLELTSKCYDAVYNAGILISASAGNSARGYKKNTPTVKNIDYSTSGVPDGVSSSFSVASASNSTTGTTNAISSFSSYGVNESLELKPEITAVGGSVYSSVPNNGYATKSGTSMSAPHITGITALMNEYLDKTNPQVTGRERVDLIQNLLMSTATPITNASTKVPYSPRVQGAGMVNTENATKTPAILIGDNGKTKLSLKDELTDTLNLKFTAKNLTDETVTFDTFSVSVLTDNYTKNSSDGKYYVGASRSLTINEIAAPESITIAGNTSTEISITVKLDSTELSENAEIFENGFFIDGFVKLQNSAKTIPNVGIPFTGFYGDWTKAPVFDSTEYDDGGCTLVDSDGFSTFMAIQVEDDLYKNGYNAGTGNPNKEYIAASPNGDSFGDNVFLFMIPMRTISELSLSITDENGNTVSESEVLKTDLNKFYLDYCYIDGISDLSDGDYTLSFQGKYLYEKQNATKHTLSLPIYIDTVAPFVRYTYLNGTELGVHIYENKYMEYIKVVYPTTEGTVAEQIFYYPEHNENSTYKIIFDLENLNTEKADEIKIELFDNAKNYYSNTFSCLKGEIVPQMTKFSYTNGELSTSFDVINKGEEIENCSVILGLYDENGKLIHSDVKENVLISSGEDTIDFSIVADISDAKICKMYIWNPKESLAPIDTYKKFNISALLE